MTLGQLYEVAANRGIEIDDFQMQEIRSVSLPEGWVAMDRRKFADETEYKCVLAHEIGHCVTGSFYDFNAGMNDLDFNERQANLWAVETLVPIHNLRYALRSGKCYPKLLAQMFDVTEKVIEVAIEIYDGF